MKAPFPWFGGKRRVADIVWQALGDVDNYVEPFAGSLAVLLERPVDHGGIATGAETVNDKDAYVANFWRALTLAPDEVAKHADWPVNETDLFARHLWLVNEGKERIARMEADPDFYDAKVAGWWVWGQCAWIGSGWCSGKGPWGKGEGGRPTKGNAGRGVNRKRPHLSNTGQGVNRKRPHLGNTGQGVNRQLPHLGNTGKGAPHSAGDMTFGGSGAQKATWDQSHWRKDDGEPLVYGYMRALQARLRRVRVCSGDWSRVITRGALNYGRTVGVFLDPPYDMELRSNECYSTDTAGISAQVREWAIAHGDDSRLRIALCGYDGEHEMPQTWRVHEWKAAGGYAAHGSKDSAGKENRHKERIWFSPSCIHPAATTTQGGLFPRVPVDGAT